MVALAYSVSGGLIQSLSKWRTVLSLLLIVPSARVCLFIGAG